MSNHDLFKEKPKLYSKEYGLVKIRGSFYHPLTLNLFHHPTQANNTIKRFITS